jgi:hypothetical protein
LDELKEKLNIKDIVNNTNIQTNWYGI